MARKEESTKVMVGVVIERTESILRELQDQNLHLTKINGSLQKHQDNLVAVNTTIYGKGEDKGMAGWVIANGKRSKRNTLILTGLVVALGVSGVLEWQDIIHIFGG